MRNKSLVLLLALAAVFAAGAQSPAAAAASFADFPIDPHATTISSASATVPGYVGESSDSMSTIDRWYRSEASRRVPAFRAPATAITDRHRVHLQHTARHGGYRARRRQSRYPRTANIANVMHKHILPLLVVAALSGGCAKATSNNTGQASVVATDAPAAVASTAVSNPLTVYPALPKPGSEHISSRWQQTTNVEYYDTKDDGPTVAAWYTAHLPADLQTRHGCARQNKLPASSRHQTRVKW